MLTQHEKIDFNTSINFPMLASLCSPNMEKLKTKHTATHIINKHQKQMTNNIVEKNMDLIIKNPYEILKIDNPTLLMCRIAVAQDPYILIELYNKGVEMSPIFYAPYVRENNTLFNYVPNKLRNKVAGYIIDDHPQVILYCDIYTMKTTQILDATKKQPELTKYITMCNYKDDFVIKILKNNPECIKHLCDKYHTPYFINLLLKDKWFHKYISYLPQNLQPLIKSIKTTRPKPKTTKNRTTNVSCNLTVMCVSSVLLLIIWIICILLIIKNT